MLRASRFGDADAPTLVLLPAIGQCRSIWYAAARALADAGRCAICLDPRGHGDSDPALDGAYDLSAYAADLKSVLGQLSSRATVVGIGPGGLTALVAAGEGGPGLISAVVLVGVTAWVDENVAGRIGKAITSLGEEFDSADAVLAAIAAIHPLEPFPTATDRLLDAFERGPDGKWTWRGDRALFGAFGLARESARIEEAAAHIAVPTMLIRGTLNETVSLGDSRRLQVLIRDSEIQEVSGGGHHLVNDLQDEFNAVLLEFLERRVPLQPLSYRSGADPRLLRDALGCFGTGVTVVTTMGPDASPVGFTANSFTSVSLDPPLVLFCIARKSANLAVFQQASGFAINILHIGQQPTSNRFARPSESRFDGVDWEIRTEGGSPILIGSRASFDCRTYAMHDGGDHLIVVGEVKQADFEPHRDPLLFLQGKYHRLHFG
ncbi:MAG: alpha/beta fold hydrolase [Novosphingobium sp.]|nr:alpha/beta fold hydrolase [Novosphingobium sp.]